MAAPNLTLWDQPAAVPTSPPSYVPDLDADRLDSLELRVYRLMRDGQPRTLGEIQQRTGGSEGGIHARLRSFRATSKIGPRSSEVRRGVLVRERRGEPKAGLWAYRFLCAPEY
jgi:hypothetical protein